MSWPTLLLDRSRIGKLKLWKHVFERVPALVSKILAVCEDCGLKRETRIFGGVVIIGTVVYFVSMRLWLKWRTSRNRRVIKERGKMAQLAIQTLIDHLQSVQETEGLVDQQREDLIMSLDLTVLHQKLWRREFTALEVLRAYQRKAIEVNSKLNCITEPIFEAEAWAVELDQLDSIKRKPLHGIPVSIKDSFFMEGYDCHLGFACLAFNPASQDADIIKLLKVLGAVPFVRTNFPQGLMTFACSNPAYGQTVNPHDRERGPGGSSGGEAALIAGGGSILGIGSDIGGSVRMPSQMCGIYGLKPTVERILNKGHIPMSSGQTLVRNVTGFLARDMAGLIKLSEELFTPLQHRLDPTVPPIFFRDEMFDKRPPLRIGYYTSLKDTGSVHPAVTRAVLEAKAVLEDRYRYELVEFEPHRAFEVTTELFHKACFGDDFADSRFLQTEVLDPCVGYFYYFMRLPASLRYLIGTLTSLTVDRSLGRIMQSLARLPKKVVDWWHLQEKIETYQREFLMAWQAQRLDALIGPGLPFPAVTTGLEVYMIVGETYHTLYNLLNYPAGMVPVTNVTSDDITRMKDPNTYPRTGIMERTVVKDCLKTTGLPVGVQVISLPFQEEMVLRVMKDIDFHTSNMLPPLPISNKSSIYRGKKSVTIAL